MAEAFETGRSLTANDLGDDPLLGGEPGKGIGISSFLVVPLKREGNPFGIMSLANKEGGFDGKDIEIVEDLSTSLAAALNQKQMEESLRISEEQNRTLVDSITEGLVIVDEDIRLTYVNDSLLKLLGYRREDVENKVLFNFLNEENKKILQDQWRRRKKGEAEPYEIAFQHADGSNVFTMVYPKPFLDKQGKFIGALALVTDLSQRKIKEAHLLQAQKLEAIGQLAAGIAHEINTPTNFVANNVRFFKDSLNGIISLLHSYSNLKDLIKGGGATGETLARIEKTMEAANLDFVLEEIPVALEETLEGLDHIADIVRSMKEFAHPGLDDKIFYNVNDGLKNTATVSQERMEVRGRS